MRGPYPKIGVQFDRVRTVINSDIDDIWADIKEVNEDSKSSVSTAITAKQVADVAVNQSQRAEEKADRVRAEFDEVIADGNSNAEVSASRVDMEGNTKSSLPDRLLSDFSESYKRIEVEQRARLNNQSRSNSYGKSNQKVRTESQLSICIMGDSTIYGTDFNSTDKRAPSPNPAGDGTRHSATRASITPSESLEKYMRAVYGDKVTVTNRGFSGDGTRLGFSRWPIASGADICIISYGINDATNSSIPYMGDLDEFLFWYRKIIERELANNTSVLIMTPIKQRVVSSSDTDSRTDIDVFSAGVLAMAREFGIDVIEGNVLLEGYSSAIYSDGIHLNGEGYDILGAKLTSVFIGKGPLSSRKVRGGTVLGTRPQLDAIKLVGGVILGGTNYPTPDEYSMGSGVAARLDPGNKIVYSFYCEDQNTVIIPTFYSGSSDVQMELNFGVRQAQHPMSYSYYEEIKVNYEDTPSSRSTIRVNDLTSNIYSKFMVKKKSQPVLLVTSRGWHTLTITPVSGRITFHGIELMTYDTYLNKVVEEVNVTLVNGASIFDEARRPKILVSGNGDVRLQGSLNTFSAKNTEPFGNIPAKFAPKGTQSFSVAISGSTGGGYAVIDVRSNGDLYFVFSSTGASLTNLNGVRWSYIA